MLTNIKPCTTIVHMQTLSCDYEGHSFRVDILMNNEKESTYEAWLYEDCSGLKELMFGVPVRQKITKELVTYLDFINMVTANLEDYVLSYFDFYIGE